MTVLTDVIAELFGMFVADARLSAAILAVVALSAALRDLFGVPDLLAGAALALGCVLVLVESVCRGARARRGA